MNNSEWAHFAANYTNPNPSHQIIMSTKQNTSMCLVLKNKENKIQIKTCISSEGNDFWLMICPCHTNPGWCDWQSNLLDKDLELKASMTHSPLHARSCQFECCGRVLSWTLVFCGMSISLQWFNLMIMNLAFDIWGSSNKTKENITKPI